MKRLMIQSLIRMRDAHKSFALLYPYSIPLYRGLGWEIISNKMTYTIKDTQIPRKLNEPGYVRRVSWDDKEFKELHTKFAEKTHGCLYRNNLAWEEYWRWDEDDTSVAIYYSKDDVPYGYMVYMISSDVMHVKEMIYLNREAQLGLWEFIHAHDSMIDEVQETITTVSQSHLNSMTAILKRQSAHTQWGELLISDSSLPNMPATRTNHLYAYASTLKMTFSHGTTVTLHTFLIMADVLKPNSDLITKYLCQSAH